MDLIEDAAPSNNPEFTVSELSGAVKRVIEGEFGLVRVRGEVGRVSKPASGHLYFNLKDDRSSLDALCWKGQIARLQVRPEEGMEVVATGRLTTFPGGSRYQIVVEDLAPAGTGALMAMLEKRRLALAAEGLFDAAGKQPIPYLPQVIGVVTSPTGAVIRDILHRLRDRFPRHVLIWPVPVQGAAAAPAIAAAIRGFNALPPGGAIPRPDVLIVARGGGSIEDLWAFNEEIVVRAAADSRIPLISAVGHETDTTLIDFAADLRAPTPTAAAERAVPVRADLIATLDGLAARLTRGVVQGGQARAQRLRDLARALPRIEALTSGAAQRLDAGAGRLQGALGLMVAGKRSRFDRHAGALRPEVLAAMIRALVAAVEARAAGLTRAMATRDQRRRDRLAELSGRLARALSRTTTEAAREVARGRDRLSALSLRLDAAPAARVRAGAEALARLDRMRQTLGYAETLRRGYAVIRGDGAVVTTKADAERAGSLEIEFADGRLAPGAPRPPRRREPGPAGQGSLF